jgi:hypothetical protein
MTLDELGLKFATDKASTYHDFLRFYDRVLSPLRGRSFVMFEIGVYKGGSVATWAEYFPNAKIVGLDIDSTTSQYQTGPIQIRIGDATNPLFLSSVIREFGQPLIVLDDGSHLWQHQINTFKYLFPSLLPGGVFIIEALHTSFESLRNEYSAGAPVSGYDYLQALNRALTGAGWMGDEKPHDAFIAKHASSVESIEWAKGTCVVRKR